MFLVFAVLPSSSCLFVARRSKENSPSPSLSLSLTCCTVLANSCEKSTRPLFMTKTFRIMASLLSPGGSPSSGNPVWFLRDSLSAVLLFG